MTGAKITALKVPSTYIIEDTNNKSDGLILDCEYDVDPNEKGFVLKWLHNDIAIYQYIPSHKMPKALSWMKDKIDTTFTVSEDRYYKHRAVFIPKPTHKMNGTYTCVVSSLDFNDKRSADLQIIGKDQRLTDRGTWEQSLIDRTKFD